MIYYLSCLHDEVPVAFKIWTSLMGMNRQSVVEFETDLDECLASRSLFRLEPAATIVNMAGAASIAFSRDGKEPSVVLGARISDALEVALPVLIQNDSGVASEISSEFVADMEFLAHYYVLREYLYYSYNSPGSMEWRFASKSVSISIHDGSIARQFAHNYDRQMRELLPFHFRSFERTRRLHQSLKGAEEFGDSEQVQEAFAIVSDEAAERMVINFDVLGGESSTVLLPGGYEYGQFYRVYTYLLAKMLYHRHYAEANGTWASFIFPASDLLNEVATAIEMDKEIVKAIFRDLVYTRENSKIPSMCFPLIKHHTSDDFVIPPERFISSDGLSQFLRVQAIRRPQWFTAKLSNEIGRNLVTKLAAAAEGAGFGACKNVDLARFDPSAPDIDLIIWSREPTLGYVLFLIEVKAIIPGLWSKDYLRVLQPDSLSKALKQVAKIRNLLESSNVANYVASQVLAADPEPLPKGVVCISQLIVSSQNSGMFFGHSAVQIIDHLTWARVLEESDGDVAYVLDMLQRVRKGGNYEVTPVKFQLKDRAVTYEGVQMHESLIFPKNSWRSAGLDHLNAQEFLADGGELFDIEHHVGIRDGLPVKREDVE